MSEEQEILRQILESERLAKEGFGKPNNAGHKKRAKQLRGVLAHIMKGDHLFVDGWHIERQHHKNYSTVAIYTQASWERYQEYKTRSSVLGWIK